MWELMKSALPGRILVCYCSCAKVNPVLVGGSSAKLREKPTLLIFRAMASPTSGCGIVQATPKHPRKWLVRRVLHRPDPWQPAVEVGSSTCGRNHAAAASFGSVPCSLGDLHHTITMPSILPAFDNPKRSIHHPFLLCRCGSEEALV